MVDLELCTDSLDGVIAAQKFNFQRIELCTALSIGGISPSLYFVKQCLKISKIPLHIMVRPRSGDFVYSPSEIDEMVDYIQQVGQLNIGGFVLGCLTPKKTLAVTALVTLCHAIPHHLDCTFHRAFDCLANPLHALETVIELNFTRILTSGQEAKAIDGFALIQQLVQQSQGRIQIMAGAGIQPNNARKMCQSGVQALHFSAHFNQRVPHGFGVQTIPNTEKMKQMKHCINSIN